MQWDELETALRTRHEARQRERTILISGVVVLTALALIVAIVLVF